MHVVCDIETDSLDATQILCIVVKEIDSGAVKWWKAPYDDFIEYSKTVTLWWGHNFLLFDAPVLRRLLNITIPVSSIRDTRVLSRLFHPAIGTKLATDMEKGGHSLADWGTRLRHPKMEWSDFSAFSDGLLKYCINDVELTDKLRRYLQERGKNYSELSINIEHEVSWILYQQQLNGFQYDVQKSLLLRAKLADENAKAEKEILSFFAPKVKKVAERKKWTTIKFETFNLASPKQVQERLAPYWEPYVKTPAGQWKVCEENLATIRDDAPAPIRNLHKWSVLNKRLQALKTWLDASGEDDRIHGVVESSGTWTYRAIHYDPNTANITGVKTKKGEPALYGKECRELWTSRDGYCLVGTDAKSIQLRVLAHHIGHPAYIHEVVDGDIHSKNMEYMEGRCPTRAQAKTFIYAWLLGAGYGKLSSVLGCSKEEAYTAVNLMINRTPGLTEFLDKKRVLASFGWTRGLDGRVLFLPSEHLALTAFLQEGESTVMKLANILWHKKATELGLDFKQVAFVHDEWQTEVRQDQAVQLGELQIQALRDTTKILNLKCPMDGEYRVGKNWAETH